MLNILLATVVASGLAAQAVPPPSPPGAVQGVVRDMRGAPIRGAVVGITGTTLYAHTDAAGRYRLAPISPGETRVRAAAIGYVPAAATVAIVS
ncbi:MAG: carboxypeptidase-like regulatory domain-containing protein, partial [Gemmatimonadales bacterium]|nr:carboxypeptidase-like regulatory domain-containing protein [Gemmatimonadales bacterium]